MKIVSADLEDAGTLQTARTRISLQVQAEALAMLSDRMSGWMSGGTGQ